MIWREKRILLGILGVLLLANVVFFLTYRVQYQARLDEMTDRLAQAEGQLARTKRMRAEAEMSLAAYRKVERDVQLVYDETWSTQPKRLTLMIAEVKRLAIASNAVPRTLSFGKNKAEDIPGIRRTAEVGAKEVSIAFSVTATYEQVRRMINLFELSNQFVIIEQVGLAEAEPTKLTLNLRLKTLFREEPVPGGGNKL